MEQKKRIAEKITFVVAVNNDKVFNNNLKASPDLIKEISHEIIVMKNYLSASAAYNEGIKMAKNDLIIFVHQDVYLPENWINNLIKIINTIEKYDNSWGVLGCYGILINGESAGHVYSNGLKMELGKVQPPQIVQSLDEVILIMRKKRGLNFDPSLPGFHLYGTDICLKSKINGFNNYAISNFCIHNSLRIIKLPKEFWKSLFFLRKKYYLQLPVKTPCSPIYSSFVKLILYIVRYQMKSILNILKIKILKLFRIGNSIYNIKSKRVLNPGNIKPL